MLSVCYNKEEVDKLKGPSEKDLVYSGLEEIMCQTIAKVMKISIEENISMRMASYGIAIKRVYNAYQGSGITV